MKGGGVSEIGYYPVCKVEELPPGERLFITFGDTPIVIFNIAGDFYAIADICTHDDGPLGEGELDDYEVTCPRHGARFDIRSGEVLALPAVRGVPTFPIRVHHGMIEIGVE
jgi:3-phenylpropionate/trans-cinnamate dioxygenase ferredoxin component